MSHLTQGTRWGHQCPVDTFLVHLYEVKEWLCDTHVLVCMSVCMHVHMHMIKMFSFCAEVSFSVTTRDKGFILGIHLHVGKANINQ